MKPKNDLSNGLKTEKSPELIEEIRRIDKENKQFEEDSLLISNALEISEIMKVVKQNEELFNKKANL